MFCVKDAEGKMVARELCGPGIAVDVIDARQAHAEMRALLYEAANSLLAVVRKPHPLKDWARPIKKRTSHKKACVALARKPAVILHRMLITGEAFRWPEKEAATTA